MSMKKKMTKDLIIDSFKKLVMTMPFIKITIKEITDEAGLKRATFYNHFRDKYDLLQWIFFHDAILPTYTLIENNMFHEANYLILATIEHDKEFYKRVAKVSGQNSFRDIVNEEYKKLFKGFFNNKLDKQCNYNFFLTSENLAQFYANSCVYIIFKWIEEGMKEPASEVANVFEIVVTNSLVYILKSGKQ